MKQKLLKTWLMLCLLLVGVGTSWADEVTFDLTTNSFSESSTSLVKWTSDYVVVILNRGTSGTNANNYLGGTGTYKHTRVYDGQLLSFVAKEGYFVSKVEVTSTSSSYNIPSTGWINATASASGAVVTANANSNVDCVEVPITAAKQITSVKVTYIKDNVGNDRTITIRANNVSELKTTYGERDWTAGLVSGKTWAYKGTNGIQFNGTPYLYNTTAIPGKIKSIKMVAASGAAEKEWSVYVASEPLTDNDYNTKGTKVGSTQLVSTSGKTWDITSGNYSYFCLYKGSSATVISEITVTYTPEGGDTPSKTTPSLSFDKSTYNVSLGDDFTAPTLTNTNNVPVTYYASDVTPEGCIEVTENGTVTINGAGSATITASYDGSGSDTYNSSSASYKLVVAAPVQKYTISYATTENGTIVVKSGETVLTEGAEVAEGTELTIECTPTDADNYKFKNWQYKEGDGSWNSRYTNPQNYTMPSANVQFRANFDVIPTYTIYWSVNGSIVQTDESIKEGTNLEAPRVDDINGMKFMGWVKTPTVSSESEPSYETISKATESTTYYAVFATADGSGVETWNKVSDAGDLHENDVIAIVGSEAVDYNILGSTEKHNGIIALSKTQNSNNRAAVVVTLDGETLNYNEDVQQIKLTKGTFNDENSTSQTDWQLGVDGGFLYVCSSDKNYLRTQATNDINGLWNISITDGKATIIAVYSSNTRNYMRVNGNYTNSTTFAPIVSAYSSTSTAGVLATIYKKTGGTNYSDFTTTPLPPYTRSTATGKYGTICLPYAANVEGATVYSTSLNDDKNTVVLTTVEAMEEGKPYIYRASSSTQTFTYAGGDIVAKVNNDGTPLVGVFASTKVERGDYVLQTQEGVQKFYLVNSDDIYCGANKAYLSVPSSPENAVKAFNITIMGDETAIDALNAVINGNAKIYDLNGRQYNSLQKGINIVNGKKIVVK